MEPFRSLLTPSCPSAARACDRRPVVTEGWVDDEHLRALGRVVVAATWLERGLDHIVRILVDDGPVYDEMVSGQSVAQLCQTANRLAARVVTDPEAVADLARWTQDIREATRERNRLAHATILQSEDGVHGRALIVGHRGRRSRRPGKPGTPPMEVSASVEDLHAIAAPLDRLSERGSELTGGLVAGYAGRTVPDVLLPPRLRARRLGLRNARGPGRRNSAAVACRQGLGCFGGGGRAAGDGDTMPQRRTFVRARPAALRCFTSSAGPGCRSDRSRLLSERPIYVTAGGRRWHSRSDCEALAQGQLEASDAGLPNHPIRRVASAGDRQPCGWCVSEANLGAVTEKIATLQTDTSWESVFRDNVLGQLPELAGWDIRSQPSLQFAGRTYRPDFTLTSGPLRIAIEIDGANKGPDAPSHDDWTRRQTAFVADGWEVLRFTNRQVVHEGEYCRRQLASTVARLRERSRLTGAGASAAAAVVPASAPHPAPVPPRSSAALWIAAGVAVAGVALGGIYLAAGGSDGGTDPVDDGRGVGFVVCPASHPLKGNAGSRVAHQPGGEFYDKTKPEVCFADEAAAQDAGYRVSRR
jgi:very-short-patch-repair endonuclease